MPPVSVQEAHQGDQRGLVVSRGYWSSVQAEVEEEFAAAESRGMCLCVKGDRTRQLLDRRAKAGTVVAPFPRVYARIAYWRSLSPSVKSLHVIRAAAALHPEWVFCGTSAAMAHGLQVAEPNPSAVHILGGGTCAASRGKHVVRHPVLTDDYEKFEVVAGVKATPLDRTIADCLRTLPMPAGLAVADSALRDYGLAREDLAGFVRAQPRARGSRQALQTIGWADGRSENGGESVARGIMIELGFACLSCRFLWKTRRTRDASSGSTTSGRPVWPARYLASLTAHRSMPTEAVQARRSLARHFSPSDGGSLASRCATPPSCDLASRRQRTGRSSRRCSNAMAFPGENRGAWWAQLILAKNDRLTCPNQSISAA